MFRNAFLIACGLASGLVVGTFTGLLVGFKVADGINKVSIGTPGDGSFQVRFPDEKLTPG